MTVEYSVIWPLELNDEIWSDVAEKGWLDGVQIVWSGGEIALSIYDRDRLPHAIAIDMERLGYFAAGAIVVVRTVTPDEIAAAIRRMADREFLDL